MPPHLTAHSLAMLAALLRQTHAQPLDGLGRSMNLSASQVAAAMDQLRQTGCDIDVHPQRGVRLRRTGLGCWADFIESRRRTDADTNAGQSDPPRRLGRRLLVYAHTASTQLIAKKLSSSADQAARHDGWVIVADHQTAGRGRLGRQWLDQPGGQLLMTAIIAGSSHSTDRLMLAACHALALTVEQATQLPVRVRWPNDLMLRDRKLAGILVETVERAALVGVGLNVALDPASLPPPLDQLATSLAAHGGSVDRLTLLDVLLDQIDHAVHHAADAELHDAWRARSDMLQQRITVRQGDRTLTGRVLDIDPLHGLLLEVEHGPVVTLPAATTRLVLNQSL
ncbi:MAG: biotin--[acetyl-CoA-carboxylase] ligase [Phycisphaeraceae bacterium]